MANETRRLRLIQKAALPLLAAAIGGAMGLIRCSPSSILFGPSSEIRLGSKSASLTGDRWEYDEAADTYKILDGAVVRVSGSTASSRIIIEGTAAVTLESASVILDAEGACPIDIENGATAEIILSGTSRLSAGPGAAAIHVPGGSTLTISGAGESGALNVTGGLYSAGIGGSSGEAGGVIQISGGTVSAVSGWDAARIGGGAGIGGGRFGTGGTITISGGEVSAIGGCYGAGIGGGEGADGGTITISGGKITATGPYMGAGIGGGVDHAGGIIDITGGEITATGYNGGAGIGGGGWGAGGTVSINRGGVGTSTGTANAILDAEGVPGNPIGPGVAASGGSFNGVPDGWPEAWMFYEW